MDGSGNIWVVDLGGVHEFDPDGTLLQDVWDSGVPAGFAGLQGVAFDSQGRLYLADKGNQRVLVYEIVSNTLVYSTTIGETGVPGGDDGHFDGPSSVATDSSDRLYVTDTDNHRVQRCTDSGGWTCTTFTTVGGGGISWGFSVWVDTNDAVFVTNPALDEVIRCDSAGICARFVSTDPQGPSDVAVDSAGNVFVSFWEGVEGGGFAIHKYDSSGAPLGVFAGVSGVPYTTDDQHINAPGGIHVDANDDIAFLAGQQLIKMDAGGDRFWEFGVPGVYGGYSGDEEYLFLPVRVDVDANGNSYVANQLDVRILDEHGTYSATLGTGCCGGEYGFWFATGVAVDQETGTIYVSDSGYHRVQVYNSSLVYQATLGEEGVPGSDNAHFSNPGSVHVDQAGNIYVADRDNCRVQKFNRQRVYQMTFGITGECDESFGKLGNVADVAVDSQGRVFLTYWGYVQVYDEAGNYLTNVGGRFDGQLAVDLDSAGNVYVADSFNHIIQVFAPGVPGWRQVNINGFGDRWGGLIGGLVDFNGQLYAGISGGDGARIWRQSGTSWEAMVTDGFGSADNLAIDHLYPFDGQLYAGTVNDLGGGEVWRSSNGLDWTNVVTDGFGDPTNGEIMRFTEFNSAIYAGTWSYTTTHGAEIWRSITGNAGDWSRVVANGFNDDAGNGVVLSFEPYNGYLYAGTMSATGGEVWRSSTGNTGSWTQANADGFGDAGNGGVSALSAFGGHLYAATHHNTGAGSEVWRCQACDGTDWQQVVDNGFGTTGRRRMPALEVAGGYLFLAIGDNQSETWLGVWRTANGTNWEQVGFGGFGDPGNSGTYFDNAMTAFHNSLYIGTSNWFNGGEVWQFSPQQVFLPLVVRNH